MNSLQIDYINALANQERNRILERDVNAKVGESEQRSRYLSSQAEGQRLDNLKTRQYHLKLLPKQLLNAQYKLDMDNAMLYNTVDKWVNDGKKLSNFYNAMWNPYWNTTGNLPSTFSNVVGGVNSLIQLPFAPLKGMNEAVKLVSNVKGLLP